VLPQAAVAVQNGKLNFTVSLVHSVIVPLFHPEYGRFMLESTPGAPYSNKVTDLLTVEGNMRYRFDENPFPEAIPPDSRPQDVHSLRNI